MPGPALVTFLGSANNWIVPLTDMMVVSKITGFNRGMVILKNCWEAEAPSIRAASYTELSIFCRPAR
jgi:hypothetical protein